MRDSARKLADRFHLQCLFELLLRRTPVRDIEGNRVELG